MLFALHRIPVLRMGIPVHEILTAIMLIAHLHRSLWCYDEKEQYSVKTGMPSNEYHPYYLLIASGYNSLAAFSASASASPSGPTAF
jgi:hypothetical protein